MSKPCTNLKELNSIVAHVAKLKYPARADSRKRKKYAPLVKKHALRSENLIPPEHKLNIQKEIWRKRLLDNARSSAAARSIMYTLKLEDIILLEICPLLGCPIDYNTETPYNPKNPSIDRIDSNLHYTKENIHVVSYRGNILKRDATKDELIALGNWASK